MAALLIVILLLTGGTDLESLREQLAEGEYAAVAEQAAALAESLDGLAAAEALDLFVEAGWRSGKAGEPATREAALRALEIKREHLDEGDPGIAVTLHHLGVVDYFRGEYDAAREVWEEALAIRTNALGRDHADVGESMNALANLTNLLGEFDEARRYYEGSLAIREKTLGPDHFRVGQSLNNLAVLATWTGDYAAALPLAERSLAIKEAALGPEHPQVASSLNSLADIYDRSGENERALALFERAAKVWEEALGPDHPDVAAALNNLAEQHRRAGRFEQAEPLYRRVATIWENANGSEHFSVALVASNHALLLEARGELDEAEALNRKALAIREAAYGAEHFEVAESLQHLSRVLTAKGRYGEALAFAERSVAIFRESVGESYPGVAESQLQVALVRALIGESDDAFALALRAETIGRDHLRLTGRSLSERHALRYAAQRRSGLDLALSLAAQRPLDAAPLLDAIVRSRAVVLDEMAARNRSVNRSADPEVARLAEDLAEARERLANLVVRGPGDLDADVYRKLVASTRGEKERAERALGAASAEFARQQQRAGQGLEAVAAHLPDGSALVAFVQYDHLALPAPADDGSIPPPDEPRRSYAAVILGGDEARVVRLGEAERLDASVTRWKREAARGTASIRVTADQAEARYREAGAELRALLWDTLELERSERVFLVPDGSINLVSFASLPTGDSEYLIESGPTLHYLSAERDLIPGDETTTGRGLFVLGAPDYDSVASDVAPSGTRAAPCGDFESLRFAPLPAARAEANEVLALWEEARDEPATLLEGAAATEAAVKSGVGGRRIVHLATHGFFLGGDCASGNSGSRGLTIKKAAKPQGPGVEVSPLLRSGLALAGANERDAGEEDGVLTAEEIAGLDLSGVEWAVLSACDTGVGEIQAGEGVFGLRRAVQLAGVRTLIMSLWPVDDEATRAWMNGLYRARLVDGRDSAAAVRQAGRSLVERRRAVGESTHPFYWAAFVAAGDPR